MATVSLPALLANGYSTYCIKAVISLPTAAIQKLRCVQVPTILFTCSFPSVTVIKKAVPCISSAPPDIQRPVLAPLELTGR